MKIHDIVKSLLSSGYTQKSLADKLTDLGSLTHQSTIHRIASDPEYQTGSDKTLLLFQIYIDQNKAA